MVQRWIYMSIMRCNDTNKIFFKIIVECPIYNKKITFI